MKYFLIFSFVGFYLSVKSQHTIFCATDEMHQHLFETHPEFNPGIVRAHEKLEEFTTEFTNSLQPKSNNPYIIPVVFHVIHNYGPENISDAQILDGIEQANIQLRKLNADTTDIVAAFEGIAADSEIELRLARLDPDGNCTSGITRTVSSLTSIGDHQVKSLIQWPPDQYLNIYVCNQAAGLAGHAMLPAAADTVPEWDGIVMQHSYVGTIGTSDYFRRTVLTHEIGHYLNLQHIWGGNNVPNYFYLPVAQSGNCDYDDGVTDTPNTIGWQSCNLSGQSCGDLDNVQNYMDYAYCARMFTEGQKLRMHACLNSSIAGRNNLWTTSNLAATGTDGSYNELCAAHISADKKLVCTGEPVEFADLSYYNVSTRDWEFFGADTQLSSDSTVSVTYSQPGVYDVKITVSDGNNTIDEVFENYITVFPSQGSNAGLNESFEWEPSFDSRFIITDPEKTTNWEISTPGYMSNQSIMVNNFEGPESGVYAFISKPIDVSNLSALALRFDAAFARYNSSNNDVLSVKVSNDCGESWLTRRTLFTNTLVSLNDTLADPFIPNNETEWKKHEILTFPPQFYVENLIVMFEFTAGGGNNIYIDNIQIGHPDELSVSAIYSSEEVLLYPNPANDYIQLEGLDEHQNYTISIFNAQGKKINMHQSGFKNMVTIPLENMPKGVYSCHVLGSKGIVVKKFVIV
jgi:PKD repeat protein